METLGRQEDITIGNLAALKQALEKRFQRALEAGMVTVKTSIAYNRDLMFREVSVADAERDFERLMQDAGSTPQGFHTYTERPYRILEDHMFHHLVKVADANNIPMQIHTGLHAGYGQLPKQLKSHTAHKSILSVSTAFEVVRVFRVALSLVVGVLRIRTERSTASWERLAGRDHRSRFGPLLDPVHDGG